MPQFNRNDLTLAACAVCPGVVLGVFMAFPIWAPAWMSAFGLSRSSTMLIYSASGILMTLTMPIVGRLLTRVPAWQLIALGAVLLGGGIVLTSVLDSPLLFAAIYALAIGPGVELAGLLPCQSLTARLFPSRVGAVAGLMMVAMAAVGVVLPVALTRLQEAIGWREAFAATGVGVLVLILPLALTLLRHAGQRGAAADATPGRAIAVSPPTGQILKSGSFWIILAGIMPMTGAPNGVQANFMPILADHGLVPGQASFALSAFAVGTALGAALFSWLADRVNPRVLLLAMALLAAAALVALAGHGGLAVAVAAAVVMGLAGGGVFPMGSVFVFRQFGAGYASALGLLNSFMLPYIFVPPLIGWVRDRSGSYSLVLLAMVPVVILGALGTWRLKPASAAGQRVSFDALTE